MGDMVSTTRSGRLRKDEDTSSSRSGSKDKDVKCSTTLGSATTSSSRSRSTTDKASDGKGSEIGGSATTDSHSLGGSTLDTPTKKSSASTLNTRRSQRLEKQGPSISPIKQSPEQVKKKRSQSPMRRSERIEKLSCSNSPCSKTSKNKDTEKKKEGTTRKEEIMDPIGRIENVKHNVKRGKKRKTLDARTYRAWYTPTAKAAKVSDIPQSSKKADGISEDVNLGGSASKEGKKNGTSVQEASSAEEAHDASSAKEAPQASFAEEPQETFSADEETKNDTFAQELSSADATSSSLSNRSKSAKSNSVCHKKQGADNDLQNLEHCNVNGNTSHSLSNVLISEEDNGEGNSEQEAGEQSSTQRVNSAVIEASSKIDVSLPVEEDRGGNEVRDGIGVIGEKDDFIESNNFQQPEKDHNVCLICKRPGTLLCCDGKGCKSSFHLSCIDPPLKEAPYGVWHCLCCVRKKIESGIHSVSEGVESVLNVQEVSDCNGMKNEKQYLVKYIGLAHVHNRWVPENELLLEAPNLVAKFNKNFQKEKVILWKEEWTVPQRLLGKRIIMPPNLADEYFGGCDTDVAHCYYEWLVKWTGLGYEHATWEFETSSCLTTTKAMALRKDYEDCREDAKKTSDPSRADKVLEIRKNPLRKLLILPNGSPLGVDNAYLNYVNKFRECWHRSENAVLANDQERIIKVILFILALLPDVCQPVLIISTLDSLSLWESEFMRVAPSVNLVVYNGDKGTRKMIHDLEFYEEGGCIMFKVLLSHPGAIVEDFTVVDCIGWEAVIVDDCQLLKVSKHLDQFKNLSAGCKLLLYNGLVKDTVAEYLNLLSLLDSKENQNSVDGLTADSNVPIPDVAVLKERFARYYINECKPESSKFVEFWVPVQLSNVQLEQYCANLISGSPSLRSSSKIDHVGASRDILISTRKCCDHPYLVDGSLQESLTKGVTQAEILDIGVQASGKLKLLDKILHEMKSLGLRAVILFQFIGGDVRISIGDILDDFLRQRFGVDSYERVDSGLVMAKKQVALQMFNNKERGRFVFLIENRACLPSIKLSSVDAIIIYGSDWNPLNDFKALQKVNFDSQIERLKVFRLYSANTVEERILSFAKQYVVLESNIPNISRSCCHSLLSWGAPYLFDELDEFHKSASSSSICLKDSCHNTLLNDVTSEIVTQLSNSEVTVNTGSCSIISRVQQSGAAYSRDIPLFGEKKVKVPDEEQPHVFWPMLLDGRYPQWRYITEHSQRIRRKVQYFDERPQQLRDENDEAKKKRKRVSLSTIELVTWQPQDTRKDVSDWKADENHIVNDPSTYHVSKEHELHKMGAKGGGRLRSVQKNLHLLLKPELSKLCDTLRLPDDIKSMAETFLEYVMNNHHVVQEPKTVLQAFKISLCWRAASFLKYQLDHVESLALAKKDLHFECTKSEAESVYEKLQILNKKFSGPVDTARRSSEPNYLTNQSYMQRRENIEKYFNAVTLEPAASQPLEVEKGRTRNIYRFPEKKVLVDSCQSDDNMPYKRCTSEVGGQVQSPSLPVAAPPHNLIGIMSSVECGLPAGSDRAGNGQTLGSFQLSAIPTLQSAKAMLSVGQESPAVSQAIESGQKLGSTLAAVPTIQSACITHPVAESDGAVTEQVHNSPQAILEPLKSADTDTYIGSGVSAVSDVVEYRLVSCPVEPAHQPMDSESSAQLERPAIHDRGGSALVPGSSLPITGSNPQSTDDVPSFEFEGVIETDRGSCVQLSYASQLLDIPTAQSADIVPSSDHEGQVMSDVGNEGSSISNSVPSSHEGHVAFDSEEPEEHSCQPIDVSSLQPTEDVDSQALHHIQQLSPSSALLSGELRQTNAAINVQNEQAPCNEVQLSTNEAEVLTHNQSELIIAQPRLPDRLASQSTESQPEPSSGAHDGQTYNLRHTNFLQEPGIPLTQPFMITGRLPQALLPDPLQNELLRIRNEEDLCIRMREDAKRLLRTEYEDEIIKAKKKYERRLQDLETAFVEKKRTLDIIYNKVSKNQVLAEQFRSKFSDNKCSAARTSAPQGDCSSHAPQLHGSQVQFAQRAVPTSSMNTAPLTIPRPPAVPMSNFTPAARLPSRSPPASCPAPALASVPPVQVVHHSSQLFSSTPGRTDVNSTLPPHGNLQVGSTRRSPAPHLQSFRPVASLPTTKPPHLSGGVPVQPQPPTNHALPTTPVHLQAPTNHPPLTSRIASSGTHESESLGPLPSLLGTSNSNMGLQGDGRVGADLPNSSHLPKLGKPLDNLPSDAAVGGSGRRPSAMGVTGASTPPDIVSVQSDDES